jgi:hypothetical protein
MRTSSVVAAGLWLLFSAACSSSPTAPSQPPFSVPSGPRTGSWIGTLGDPLNGQGQLSVTLADTPIAGESVLTGTWTATFPNAARNASGDISGSIATAGGIRLFLTRRPPLTCGNGAPPPLAAGSFFGDVLSLTGNTITGTYTYVDCTGSAPGTLTLTKQ